MQAMNDTELTFKTQIQFKNILSETNIDLNIFLAYCLADIGNLKH